MLRSLVLLLAVVAAPRLAEACTCVLRSSCQHFAAATAVFAGEVLDVAEGASGPKVARMRVLRAYKGVQADAALTVTMPRGTSGSCSLDVVAGTRYVIYADTGNGKVSTGLCQGSYRLEGDTVPDLPPPPGVTGLVQQRLTTAGGTRPAPNVEVWVQVDGRRISTRTDWQGRFTLRGVPPGHWNLVYGTGPELKQRAIHLESAQDCADVIQMLDPPRPEASRQRPGSRRYLPRRGSPAAVAEVGCDVPLQGSAARTFYQRGDDG